MAKRLRHTGALESGAANDSYTDTTGAYMDYDGSANAQFGAKAAAGGSLGLKLRTMLAGVATTVLTFAAAGGATFASTVATTARITSTVAGTSLRLAYDGTNVVDFAVTSTGGLTITPMASQAVSVTGFVASGNAAFSAQTRVGDLFRVESIATPTVTGLTGAGVLLSYDPTNKGIIESSSYSAGVFSAYSNLAIKTTALAINAQTTITMAANSGQVLSIQNTSNGAGAYGGILIGNDGAAQTAGLVMWSSGWTPTALILANGLYLYSTLSAGITINAGHASGVVIFGTNNTEAGRITAARSLVWGTAALATSATDGFLYIPASAGTPTGVPTAFTGRVPLHYDSTNHKIYVYDGGWKATAALT